MPVVAAVVEAPPPTVIPHPQPYPRTTSQAQRLASEQAALAAREATLGSERSALDRAAAGLAERERAIIAREAEVEHTRVALDEIGQSVQVQVGRARDPC